MLLERLMVEVGADTTAADRKLDKLEDRNRRWTGAVATAGVGALAGVAAGAGALIGTGVKVAADMEQARIGFTTLLGSASKADAFIGQMKTFAAKTPFEFAGLQEASSRLLAVGTSTKDVIPLMTSLGDATSAMGTGSEGISRAVTALTQMQQKGKVTGEEMLQLTEAGIPAWGTLAAAMGTDVATAQAKVTAGQVKVNTLMGGLTSYAGPMKNLAGMMDKQSASLAGMWSTLKDTVTMGLGDMATPIVQQVKGALPALTDTIGGALKDLGPQLSTFAVGLIGVLKPLLPLVGQIVGGLGAGLGAMFSALAPVLPTIAKNLGMVASWLGTILTAAAPLLGAVGELAAAMSGLLPPIAGIAQKLVSALVPAIMPVVKAVAQFVTQLVGTGEKATPFTRLIGTLAGVLLKLGPILGRIGTVAAKFATAFLDVGMNVLEALMPAVEALLPLLIPLADLLAGILEAIPPAALAAIAVAFVALTNPIGAVVLAVAGLMMAGKFLVRHWSSIAGFFTGLWRGITGAVSSAAGLITGHIGTIARVAMALATGGMSEVARLIVGHWGQITGALGSAVGKVTRFFTALPGRIVRAVGGVGKLLWEKGSALIAGLVKGYVRAYVGVARWFAGLGLRILRGVGNVARTLVGKGASLIAGLVVGYVRGYIAVAKWFGGLGGRVVRAAGNLARTLAGKGADLIGGLLGGIRDGAVKVWGWYRRLGGQIRDLVRGIGDWLFQAGKDLVGGFIRGILSKAGDLLSSAKSVITAPIDAAKGWLFLHSPSKLTRAMGVDVALGLALGLEDGLYHVRRAAGRLSNASIRSISQGLVRGRAEARDLTGATIRATVRRLVGEFRQVKRVAAHLQDVRGAVDRIGAGPLGGGFARRYVRTALPSQVAAALPDSAGRGAVYQYITHQHIAGSVVTERQLAELVRKRLVDKGAHNAGRVLAGQA